MTDKSLFQPGKRFKDSTRYHDVIVIIQVHDWGCDAEWMTLWGKPRTLNGTLSKFTWRVLTYEGYKPLSKLEEVLL